MHSRIIAAATCSLVLCAAGCAANYYKVTDPTTGKMYYTSSLQQQKSGAATLIDARTGNKVSIQNSEIAKVTKEEFDVSRYAQAQPEPKEKQTDSNPFK